MVLDSGLMALFDNVIHTEEDLTSEFSDISVVGIIPDYKIDRNKKPREATYSSSPKTMAESSKPVKKTKKQIDLDDDDFEDED